MRTGIPLYSYDIIILTVLLNAPVEKRWRACDVAEVTRYSVAYVRESFRRLNKMGALSSQRGRGTERLHQLVPQTVPALRDAVRLGAGVAVRRKLDDLGLDSALIAVTAAVI